VNGRKHGRGVYTFADGERYEGQWRDDRRSGYGIYTSTNGSRFEASGTGTAS